MSIPVIKQYPIEDEMFVTLVSAPRLCPRINERSLAISKVERE